MADSRHVTLTASTVSTVTLDVDYNSVEVVNVNGTAAVYFTVDGSTPTVKGAGTIVLPAAIGGVTVFNASRAIKLISTGTPDVSVRGW